MDSDDVSADSPESPTDSPPELPKRTEIHETPGPLDMGQVVQTMAHFMRKHGVFAIGVSALFSAPESAYILFQGFTVPPEWTAIDGWLEGVHDLPLFVGTVLSTVTALSLAFAVHAFQQKQRWSPLDFMGQGLSAMGRGLVMQIAAGFAVVLGLIALVVPGFNAAVATFIALPVIAIEKRNVPDAFNRCYSLTRGHRLRIGLLMGVVVVVPVLLYLVLYMSIFPSEGLVVAEADWLFRIRVAATLEVTFNTVTTTVAGVLSASIYTTLAQPTEVVDTKALEEVFA